MKTWVRPGRYISLVPGAILIVGSTLGCGCEAAADEEEDVSGPLVTFIHRKQDTQYEELTFYVEEDARTLAERNTGADSESIHREARESGELSSSKFEDVNHWLDQRSIYEQDAGGEECYDEPDRYTLASHGWVLCFSAANADEWTEETTEMIRGLEELANRTLE